MDDMKNLKILFYLYETYMFKIFMTEIFASFGI